MLPIRLPNTILASRRQQPLTPSPTEPKVQVRPLTRDSLETRQHVSTSVGYGYQTKNKVSVLDGSVLPSKFEPFPNELYGMPLEEIDNFIFDEVITPRRVAFLFSPFFLLFFYLFIFFYEYLYAGVFFPPLCPAFMCIGRRALSIIHERDYLQES